MAKYCTNCGNPVDEGDTFCTNCGGKVGASSSQSKNAVDEVGGGLLENAKKVIHEVTAKLGEGLNEKRIEMEENKPTAEEPKLKVIYAIVQVVGIIAFLLFITVPEILTCPVCHGTFLVHYLCSFCGGDGKVTILEYILYLLGEWFGA